MRLTDREDPEHKLDRGENWVRAGYVLEEEVTR
jgi:hypothetical protein